MEPGVTNYRTYLRDKLIEKKKINPQFSLRSFSKVLGVQPTFLSYILNGKRDLSDEMIEQFIERLKISGKEAKIFELIVKLEKTKNVSIKNKILETLKQIDPSRSQQRDLTVEHFTLISEWHHYVIFMLIDIEDFDWTIPNVASAVGVNTFEVKHALERLRSLDLIEYKDEERPVKIETRILAKSTQSSSATRKYHSQLLKMTEIALDNCPAQDRFNGSEIVTLSEDQVAEAAEIFEECFKKVFSLAKQNVKHKKVYQVGIHLFPVSRLKQNTGVKNE